MRSGKLNQQRQNGEGGNGKNRAEQDGVCRRVLSFAEDLGIVLHHRSDGTGAHYVHTEHQLLIHVKKIQHPVNEQGEHNLIEKYRKVLQPAREQCLNFYGCEPHSHDQHTERRRHFSQNGEHIVELSEKYPVFRRNFKARKKERKCGYD